MHAVTGRIEYRGHMIRATGRRVPLIGVQDTDSGRTRPEFVPPGGRCSDLRISGFGDATIERVDNNGNRVVIPRGRQRTIPAE